MKFIAVFSTDDGHLTRLRIYKGQLLMKKDSLRIAVFTNRGVWMTFDPKALVPALDD